MTQYWLWITTAGGADLFNADPGPGLVTSKTVTGLPTDGSAIHVRLYSHIGSAWYSLAYTYSAAGPAVIISPVNGSTLTSSSVTFQWTTGTGVTQYWLTISKVGVGGGELFNADPGPGLVTSRTINGLPIDGSTIYVSLYSHIGSNWNSLAYTYTAAGGAFVAAPTYNPATGTYTSAQTVTISTTTSGASIRYTTDNSTPSSTVGTLYSGPITVGNTLTVKAIAYATGMTDSTVTSSTYTINPPVAAPTFSPGTATYTSAQNVAISTMTFGASIRYTADNSTPSSTVGTLYSGPISVGSTLTVKAIAYKTGMTDSAVTSATYTIIPPVAAPTFSPGSGTYTSARTVAISTTTTGASIRYTTDNSPPSSTAGMLYSGPITVGNTMTVKAIGYKAGRTDSAVTSADYTISPSTPVAGPSMASSSPDCPQSVTDFYILNDGTQKTLPYYMHDIFGNPLDASNIDPSSLTAGSGVTATLGPIPSACGMGSYATFDVVFTATHFASTGAHNLNFTWAGQPVSISGAVKVKDATPQINFPQQYPPASDGSFYVVLYGTNFGPAPGSVAACVHEASQCNGTPDMSVTVAAGPTPACPYCSWSDNQVNVLLIPSPTASGIYDLQITSGGETPGLGFQAPPGKPAGPAAESNRVAVSGGCPTSVTIAGITPLPLQAGLNADTNFPHFVTGVGILATMFVGPLPYNWNGARITESLSTVSDTCPIPPFPTPCTGSDTFTVGPPGQPPSGSTISGTTVPPLGDNAFFDTHATVATTDLLGVAGLSSCSTVCAQMYTCGGKTIGNFTITRTYTESVIGAASVTLVGVQKQ